jgi:hypothetical protein
MRNFATSDRCLKEVNFLKFVIDVLHISLIAVASFLRSFKLPQSIERTTKAGTAGQKTTATLPERDAAFGLTLTAVSSYRRVLTVQNRGLSSG